MTETVDVLDNARRTLGLSISALWWHYFAIGGMSTELEIEAMLYHALVPTTNDCDTLAVALNERFRELGQGHPLRYSTDN